MKLIVINGPNLNFLGIREPEHYGRETYEDLIRKIDDYCAARGIEAAFYQSNHEGDLVDQIRAQLPLLAHRRTDAYRLEQLGANHSVLTARRQLDEYIQTQAHK